MTEDLSVFFNTKANFDEIRLRGFEHKVMKALGIFGKAPSLSDYYEKYPDNIVHMAAFKPQRAGRLYDLVTKPSKSKVFTAFCDLLKATDITYMAFSEFGKSDIVVIHVNFMIPADPWRMQFNHENMTYYISPITAVKSNTSGKE